MLEKSASLPASRQGWPECMCEGYGGSAALLAMCYVNIKPDLPDSNNQD
jgi:hypothetical protein